MHRGIIIAVLAWIGACRSFSASAPIAETDAGDAAASGPSPADAGPTDTVIADAGPTIGCGSIRCPASGGCCYDVVDGGTTCVASAAACKGAYFLCGGHADCASSLELPGTVCCSSGHFVDGGMTFQLDHAECRPPGSCHTHLTEDILCDPSDLGAACEGTTDKQTCGRVWEPFIADPFKAVSRCDP